MTTLPTTSEMDEVLDWCQDAENDGNSKFPGMSYEQGVMYAILWMRGDSGSPKDS